MADLYIWEKFNVKSSTSTVGTGRYTWYMYNNIRTTTYSRSNWSYQSQMQSPLVGWYRHFSYDVPTGKTYFVSPIGEGDNFPTGVAAYRAGSGSTVNKLDIVGNVTITANKTYVGNHYTAYVYPQSKDSKGSLIGSTTNSYNAYTNGALNADGRWYERGSEQTTASTSYSKGSYIGTVTAAANAYTNNARNSDGYWYIRKGLANKVPTVVLNTENNKTLYEADTLTISGTATDADNGNVVTVKYKIAESAEKALTASVSNGSSAIPFNKQLVFKGGKIYDGETAITDVLTDGNAYTLSVWAEDNQGGKSTVQTRTFYVVPNRAPSLVVNEFDASACIIDSDKFTISGTCEDADGNDMKVGYRINGGNFVQAYDGSDGNWEFELELGQLKSGENTIAIEAIDSYDFKTSQTLTLNKNTVSTQVLKGVTRYTINPPSGSAKGILLWIQHDAELTIDGCYLSLTDNAEAENFVEMENTNTANMPNSTDVVESEFVLETETPKEKIMLKIEFSRASVDVSPTIKLISGVME